ncbi:MAG: hypothetical protein GXY60_07165 [Spirochaetales bacterium]|nr:hypothetical protein [Spirochaetales bacterium]
MLKFFDALMPIGKTNKAFPTTPGTKDEVLAVMKRYDIEKAMVFHTVARDADPDDGNLALLSCKDDRLFHMWALETAYIADEPVEEFFKRAVRNGVKALYVNPCMIRLHLEKNYRTLALASMMEAVRMPLYLLYWTQDAVDNVIDWYTLADFCNMFPKLPIIAWEWRARGNRALFDALAGAPNLRVILTQLWQAQSLEAICDAFGSHRVLFSCGLPHLDPGSFQACVSYADLPQSDKEAVAYGNIEKLLANIDVREVL